MRSILNSSGSASPGLVGKLLVSESQHATNATSGQISRNNCSTFPFAKNLECLLSLDQLHTILLVDVQWMQRTFDVRYGLDRSGTFAGFDIKVQHMF